VQPQVRNIENHTLRRKLSGGEPRDTRKISFNLFFLESLLFIGAEMVSHAYLPMNFNSAHLAGKNATRVKANDS
jgi:hypothetical protein